MSARRFAAVVLGLTLGCVGAVVVREATYPLPEAVERIAG